MDIDYNTSRSQLTIKEYGRYMQKLIAYAKQLTDTEKRQKAANTIVELMAYFNPHLKNVEGFKQKLWDHLFVMADFDFDINSPYQVPTKEQMQKKVLPLAYPHNRPQFLHLGKNIEAVIQRAKKEEDADKKQFHIYVVLNAMKQTYANEHKDHVQEDVLKQELQSLTKNALVYEFDPEIKKIFQDDKGEQQEREPKKQDKHFHGKKKSRPGGGYPPQQNKNVQQNTHPNNNPNRNYNNSNSSNVSLALPPKKKKFKKRY